MSSPLKQNTNTIESILETISELPEVSGEAILQNKTVTPAAATQIVTADSDYDALNSVTVNGDANLVAANIAEGVSIFGIEGSHTGGVELPELTNPGTAADLLSGKELIDENGEVVTGTIATKASSDLTANGATVTVPSGYYASNATKSVSTATQATPTVSIDSAGKITATATQAAGYVAAGTKTGTKQLTTQAAKTITPSKSSQTAVASGRYTTGAVTVAAIPSTYITTTDATASAADILSSKTAYVNGAKITGTIASYAGSYECSGDSTGGSSAASAEWQDVFALPTTYITVNLPKTYYIEIPANFKMIAVRSLYGGNYYSASAVVMDDGSIISMASVSVSCNVSILNDENVIGITIQEGATTAEYLIV